MDKNAYLRKIACTFFLITFVFSIFSHVNLINVTQSKGGGTNNDDDIDLAVLPDENLISDDPLLTPEAENNDTVFGEGVHLTQSDLMRGYYSAAQGSDGRLHCIWKQQHTQRGFSLFYSYSNSSGVNWSVSELIYRFEEEILQQEIVVDNNDNLHIALVIKRATYSRVFYLNYTVATKTSNLMPVFTTKNYEFSSINIGISHNNTVNIAWISKHESSTPSQWLSFIQLQRINITSNEWLLEPIILFNESNPNLMTMSTEYNSVHLTWTNSSDYSSNHGISHSYYNESTKLWSPFETLALSGDYVKTINTDIAMDNGLHVLWSEGITYSKLYYLKWFTNTTTTSPTSQINNLDGNNHNAYVIENDSTGDLHLVFEDAKGFLTQIYHRTMFINNGTWTPIVQLSSSEYSIEPVFLKATSSNILGYLVFISEGSLVYQYLNTSEVWYNFGIVYYGTQQTLLQSAVVDSDGVIHLVCLHMIAGRREILYLRKLINDTRWTDFESLFIVPHDTNPRIIIDSNDTLYIFAAVYDFGSGQEAIHYSYKLKGQSNWSTPLLCYTPLGYVPNRAYYHPQMYERPYPDKPTVIVDDNNTLHLFWREIIADEMYLNYAYKLVNSTLFSTRQVLPSYQTESQVYHIDAMFDQNNTLHLVHGEFMNELEVSMIVYRSLLPNKTWSELVLVDAAYDWLFKPQMIQKSDGKLQLIFSTSRVFSGWQELYYSDLELYEKLPNENTWTFKETFMRDTVTAGYYDSISLDDDTFYLIYFSGDFSSPRWYVEQNEFLTIRKRTSEGEWENETLLFTTEFTKTTPTVIYNHVEDRIFIFQEIEMNVNWFTIQKDSDNDTLGDVDEVSWGTDYLIADTDQDGLSDGYEAKISLTNPLMNDSDWDGLSDSLEVLVVLSDPLSVDSDRDGVEDGDEVLLYYSNPNMQDSDQDSLSDDKEIFELGSDPNSNDTDGDLMLDHWEYLNNLDLNFDDSQNDEDDDGLVNLGEYYAKTDVYNPDTDSDYLTDGDEVHNHTTDPLNADTDFDTLTDWEEIMKFGTNPFLVDSDADGFSDRTEIEDGTDPNDASDNIRLRRLRKSLMYSIIPIASIVIIVVAVETNFRLKAKRQKEFEEVELSEEELALEKITANDKNT